ncbi:hypothetical protein ABIA39_006303 [Nocardia sp. GAS34]|uniref:condensation domain-containing protein n=1 Tax=unclassified Nocardia TaxID=2637762 RepID=UPI003D1E6E80
MTVSRPELDPGRGSSDNSERDPSVEQPIALSAGQQGLWLAQKLSPDVPISEAQYIECHGDLDIDLLRTMGIRAGRELRREYTAPLDMTRDLLVTTAIVRLGDRHYLLYCRSHHVAMDGYGAMMIVNRIAALYTAAVQGRIAEPNRAADIRALYEADRSYRESTRFTDDQAYWVSKLADVGEEPGLADRDAPPCADSVVAMTELSASTVGRIENSAKALGVSPAAVVIAAFGCYLARRTGRDEVLVNIPVSGRTTAVLRRSAGMFVNVAPIRIVLDPGDTVATLALRVHTTVQRTRS